MNEELIKKIVAAVQQIYNPSNPQYTRSVDEDGTPRFQLNLDIDFGKIAEIANLNHDEIEAIARFTDEEKATTERLIIETLGVETGTGPLDRKTLSESVNIEWPDINTVFAYQTAFAREDQAPNNEFFESVRVPVGYNYGDPKNTRVNLSWTVPTAHDVEDYIRRVDPEGFAQFNISRRTEGQEVTPFLRAIREPQTVYPNDPEKQRSLVDYAHTKLIEFKQSLNLRFGLNGTRSRNTIPELAQYMSDHEYGRRMLERIAESGPEYMTLAKYDGRPMTKENITDPQNATDLFTHCATNAGEQRLVQIMRRFHQTMGKIDATDDPAEKERIFNEFLETPADAVFKYTTVLTNGVPVDTKDLTIFDVMHIMGTVEDPIEGVIKYEHTVSGITPMDPLKKDIPPLEYERELDLPEPKLPEEPKEKTKIRPFVDTETTPVESFAGTNPTDYKSSRFGVAIDVPLNERGANFQGYLAAEHITYQSETASWNAGTYDIALPTGLDGEAAGVYVDASGNVLTGADGRPVLGFEDNQAGYSLLTAHPALDAVQNYDLGDFCASNGIDVWGVNAGGQVTLTPEKGLESFTAGAEGMLYQDGGYGYGGNIGLSLYAGKEHNTLVGLDARGFQKHIPLTTDGEFKDNGPGGFTADHEKVKDVTLTRTDLETEPLTEEIPVQEERVPEKKLKDKDPLFEVEEKKVQKMMPMVKDVYWDCGWHTTDNLVPLQYAIDHLNHIQNLMNTYGVNNPFDDGGTPNDPSDDIIYPEDLFGLDQTYNHPTENLSLPYIPPQLLSPSAIWEWQAVTPTEYISKTEADNLQVATNPPITASIPNNLRVYEWFALTDPMTQAEIDALDPDCFQQVSTTPVGWQPVDPMNLITYDEAVLKGIPASEFEWVEVVPQNLISLADADALHIPYDPSEIVLVTIGTQTVPVLDADGNQVLTITGSSTEEFNTQEIRNLSIDHIVMPNGGSLVADENFMDHTRLSGNMGFSTKLGKGRSSLGVNFTGQYDQFSFPDLAGTASFDEIHQREFSMQGAASFADPSGKDDIPILNNDVQVIGILQGNNAIIPGVFTSNTNGSYTNAFSTDLSITDRDLVRWKGGLGVHYRTLIEKGILSLGVQVEAEQYTFSQTQSLSRNATSTNPSAFSTQTIVDDYNAASGTLRVGYTLPNGVQLASFVSGRSVDGGPLKFAGGGLSAGVPLTGKKRDQIKHTNFDMTSPGLSVGQAAPIQYSPHVAPMGDNKQQNQQKPPVVPTAPSGN